MLKNSEVKTAFMEGKKQALLYRQKEYHWEERQLSTLAWDIQTAQRHEMLFSLWVSEVFSEHWQDLD